MDPITGALILGGLNVGMGALKANQAAKQRKMEADLRAAEIEASPWTGKAPSTQVATAAPSVWADMAGGAVNALGQTAALQQAGLFDAGKVAEAPIGGLDPGMAGPGADFFNKSLSESTWGQMVPNAPGLMGRR